MSNDLAARGLFCAISTPLGSDGRVNREAFQSHAAWLLAQGADIAPIPGTTKVARLEENIGAVDVTLSADDQARIVAAVPETEVEGARYAEAGLAMVGR